MIVYCVFNTEDSSSLLYHHVDANTLGKSNKCKYNTIRNEETNVTGIP
jgi:hypothetical protein